MSISYTADQLQKKFQGAPGSTGFARIAETLREEGRHEEAVALCQAGLSQKPHDLTGRLVLGKCYIDMDRLDEAREQLEGVLRQDPRCLSAMHLLARIMTNLQWGEAAAAYYRSILELEPWDTETLARFRDVSPAGAAGMVPGPPAPSLAGMPAAPREDFASDPAVPRGPSVEEFDLNQVTGFPSADSTAGDLAGALEEVSLEDALSEPVEQPRAFAPAAPSPVFDEPKPLDVLIEEAPAAEPGVEPGADEPAPISGDDVGERLDSLFGAEDDQSPVASPAPGAGPADAEPGRLDEDFANATLQLKAMRGQEPPSASDIGSATTISGPAADLVREDAGSGAEPLSPRDTSVFAEGELLPPEERVSGEDIEARLDDLFSLHDTSTQPVMKAIPDEPAYAEPEAAAPDTLALDDDFSRTAPEAVATWSGAVPTEADPPTAEVTGAEAAVAGPAAELDANPAGMPDMESAIPGHEEGILAAETGASTQSMSADDLVTGQDVADKLEALFGEEPTRPGKAAERSRDLDPIASGSASWAAALPAAEEAKAPAADTGGMAAAAEPAWEQGMEASQSPSTDLMSTESMLPRGPGLGQSPPITGQDIEDRLDSLFDLPDEGSGSGALPRAEAIPSPEYPKAPEEVTSEEPRAYAPDQSLPAADFGDADRTMIMPAVQESPFAWPAGQDGPAGTETATPEALRTPMAVPPDAGDTLFLGNEEVFPETPAATTSFGATDTVGLEMVDGADVAERLDQIFAQEEGDSRGAVSPAAAAKAAADSALARGEAVDQPGADYPVGMPALPEPDATLQVDEPDLAPPEPPGLETGEIPLDEMVLFAQDAPALPSIADEGLPTASGSPGAAAGIMVSGDDIDSRLSELFDAPGAAAIRPMEDEETETPLFLANPGSDPAAGRPQEGDSGNEASGAPTDTVDDLLPSARADRTPAAEAVTRAPETDTAEARSLSPLQDEEEGSPEEDENAPQSAAGANVATVTLAEIYFQQGLREQALQIYRQLLEREPGNDSVRKRIQEIEASKPEPGAVPGTDQRRPRPGLKVPKRKK